MLVVSRYLVFDRQSQNSSIWSTRSGRIVDVETKHLDRMMDGVFEGIPDEVLRTLKSADILVDGATDEREAVLRENSERASGDPDIDIILVPSADCPLGCNLKEFGSYCGQVHIKEKISDTTEQLIADFIKRSCRSHHKRLKITWFGGEPLLALPRMRSMSHILKQLAARYDLIYAASIVTAGTLFTPQTARECYLSLGITSASITIDGTQEQHDARRSTKGGRRTFNQIIENLDGVFSDSELEPMTIAIRCNIDRRNSEGAEGLLDFLASRGWQSRVELYPASVHPWGNAASQAVLLSSEEFAAIEMLWHRRMIELGFRIRALPSRKFLVCRVVSSSRLVIGHDGTVHRCTESPLTPVNRANDDLGSVENWASLDTIPTWNWHEDVEAEKYPCSKCEYLPVCGGACPLSWRTGSDVPCPPFKYNGKERLRLHREVAAQIVNNVGKESPGNRQSIFGMLRAIANDEDQLEMIKSLHERLRHYRHDTPQSECSQLVKYLENYLWKYSDWRTEKLVSAAYTSTIAYLHYRNGNFDGVVSSTEKILSELQSFADSGDIDPRLAQIQSLINLLAAELRLVSAIDAPLASALLGYLSGAHSVRVHNTHLRKLEPTLHSSEVVRGLRQNLRAIIEFTGVSACG